jgi:uncharacterized membrane protein YiaA
MNKVRFIIIALLAVILLALFVSVIQLKVEIKALSSNQEALENQLSIALTQLSQLQQQINALNQRLAQNQSMVQHLSVKISFACVSATHLCNGTYAYLIGLYNNGNKQIPTGYSLAIEIKDFSKSKNFVFNVTTPRALNSQDSLLLLSSSWPRFPNGTSLVTLKAGDLVQLSVGVANFVTSVNVTVIN